MEGLDTFIVLAATYTSLDEAEADHDAVEALYHDEQAIDTFDTAVVTMDDKRRVEVAAKHEQPTRHGSWAEAAEKEADEVSVAG